MGVVLPKPGFMANLRKLTTDYGALLIFDEVITGFRVAYGGAQTIYGIHPDLTCLGKIIGGGLPVGAYGGKKEIMDMISPTGPVYQAGTFSGNPLAMTAGIETLKVLRQEEVYESLERAATLLEEGIVEIASSLNLLLNVSRFASLLTIFFTERPVVNYESVSAVDTVLFAKFFRQMLIQEIYWPPSQFEAAFVSLAHSDEDIQQTIRAIEKALATCQVS
ncbi:Glutamate-1-semialdehyde 2,1-aminomutase [subsurface metagenome]